MNAVRRARRNSFFVLILVWGVAADTLSMVYGFRVLGKGGALTDTGDVPQFFVRHSNLGLGAALGIILLAGVAIGALWLPKKESRHA